MEEALSRMEAGEDPEAFREAGNVILGTTFEVTKDPRFSRRILITPLKMFQRAAKQQGLCLVHPDADGVVRHFHLSSGGRQTIPLVAFRQLRPHVSVLLAYGWVDPVRELRILQLRDGFREDADVRVLGGHG